MSKICVVVPVYKVEKYLCECVDSIIGQTFKDFNLVLVDDGSPDNCGAICDEYAEKDERITVIHRSNGGLSAARNTGIEWNFTVGKNEWITFIDSDDFIGPEYLSLMYEQVVQNKAKIVVCDHTYFSDSSQITTLPKKNYNVVTESPDDFWKRESVLTNVAWGKLYYCNLFSDIRYPEGKIHEDIFTTYRIVFSVSAISYVEKPLIFIRQNPESITRSSWSYARMNEIEAYSKQILYFRENKKVQAYNLACRNYLCAIRRNIGDADKSDHIGNKALVKKLTRLLRKEYIKYNKYAGLTLKNDLWVYGRAFPLLAKVYKKLYKR